MAKALPAVDSRPEADRPSESAPAAPVLLKSEEGARQDAVRELERELARKGMRRWLRRLIWVLVLAGVAFAVVLWRRSHEPPPEPRFLAQPLEVRDIVEKVESTGRLKPVTEVQVGAQVSGRVVKVHVDFNSRVKKGDLLAEIDPELFGAQVGQVSGQLKAAQANLERAEARVKTTRVDLERARALRASNIGTQAEVDQAEGAYEVAVADVAAAKASLVALRSQLSSARTTLAYTKIYSPIDGIVINRAIEPGQTVAASFSAPVLFVIAEDLRKMQVLADIDEADVGKVAEGMPAKVSVDAFIGETFSGRVTQIRYSPNEVQGVVTYSAVIDVDNPELKLRPGMTATVAITTREAKGVLSAPNAALRFKPEQKAPESGQPEPEQMAPKLTPLEPGQARVFRVSGGPVGDEQLASLVVSTGISDGVFTEVRGKKLRPGLELVVEQKDRAEERRRFMGLF